MAKKIPTLNTNIAGSLNPKGSYGSTITVNNSFGTSLTTTAGHGFTINYQPKAKYHILGEDVEVSGQYPEANTLMMIATLNVLGKPFLDELHKNNVFFAPEIEEYLKVKFRDKKIDDIIN